MYYDAFDTFRKFKEIKTLDDNDKFCDAIASRLKSHLTVIPKLAMGILECRGLMDPKELDDFMNTILRSVSQLFIILLTFPLLIIPFSLSRNLTQICSAFLAESSPSNTFHSQRRTMRPISSLERNFLSQTSLARSLSNVRPRMSLSAAPRRQPLLRCRRMAQMSKYPRSRSTDTLMPASPTFSATSNI